MIHWLIKDFKVTAKRVNFLHSQVLAGKKLKKIKKKKKKSINQVMLGLI
jgi:hypothetical protein